MSTLDFPPGLLQDAADLLRAASAANEARAKEAAQMAVAKYPDEAAALLEAVNLRRMDLADLMIAAVAVSRGLSSGCFRRPDGGQS